MDRRHLFLVIVTIIVVLIIIITVTVTQLGKEVCRLNSTDITENHPLILNLKENTFILPYDEKGIYLKAGDSIRISCTGFGNYLNSTSYVEVEATCVSDKIFTVNNKIVNFQELKCLNTPESKAVKTKNNCIKKFTELQIGFQTQKGFLPIITTYFDENKMDSLYSAFTLTPKIKYIHKVNRPDIYNKENLYENLSADIDTVYKKKEQLKRFEKLLNSFELANKYIRNNYLNHGHLTANGDFVYASQRLATFYYINVAPQWKIFNEKNWNLLEQDIRQYSINQNLEIIIYTGVYGTLQLSDIENNNQPISLTIDKNSNDVLTVPKIFWKLLYEPYFKRAIVFVGHNDPYELVPKKLCTDICSRLNWLNWSSSNITEGFAYCCDYFELKKIIDYLPNFTVYGILE